MADAVTSQTLIDGDRYAVMKFTNISDGSGESAVTKVEQDDHSSKQVFKTPFAIRSSSTRRDKYFNGVVALSLPQIMFNAFIPVSSLPLSK